MKSVYSVCAVLFLVMSLGLSKGSATAELSIEQLLNDSKGKQLCGRFVADSGIFNGFVLPGKSEVIMDMGGEFTSHYFISGNVVFVKTEEQKNRLRYNISTLSFLKLVVCP